MTASQSLRSQDQDASSYASLPGTATTDFVQHNITAMKSQIAPGRDMPGCHPSRWIHELINNNFTACDMFERARRAKLDSPYTWEHEHRLVINGNQSFSIASNRTLSSICLDCHFHFVFRMAWEENHAEALCNTRQAGWPVKDNSFPWHHLVWAGSDANTNIVDDSTKYYPLLARENFVCSAAPCTFQLVLEISEPRMPSWWVDLLQDHDAIREQLRVAKQREPVRYEAATEEWATQAPLNLNTYLKNLLDSTEETVRSISKRNKRFSILFGPRCFSIFQQLEFDETILDSEGIDEGSFNPSAPAPPGGPNGTTEFGTYRAYIEDVRAEVQCLIHKAGQTGESPTFIKPVLHNDLGCQEVPNVASNALVNVDRYRVLGILPRQSREIVVNAYKRQWELVPNQRRVLVDSLMGVANDSGDEMLSDYAMTQSSVFDSQAQPQSSSDDDGIVSQALIFLGLQPPNNYTAESLLHAFRQKLAKDPGDASTARSMLLLIAQGSTDDTYQAKLLMEAGAKMSFDTAKVILGLGPDLSDSLTEPVQKAKGKLEASQSKDEKQVYLDALDALANQINSPPVKQAIKELRQEHGIQPSAAGSSGSGLPVDFSLPTGLYNIGNTCYLNSLLQYLFTVKPVRDVVLNYDDYKLDMSDKSIEARRLGGNKMQMDRGEAVVAQAFAQELAVLFQNLQTSDQASTRPSQRLANAVLLSTHTLLNAPRPPVAQQGPQPPPLPARPVPNIPSAGDDVEMNNSATQPKQDRLETASNSSSQTLVDPADAHSEHSFEQVERSGDNKAEDITTGVEAVNNVQESKERPQAADPSMEQAAKVVSDPPHSDVDMVDAEQPETVDQKVLTALEHQKRSSGTDQQDVEEVMGSIINRLQSAIRPSSIDEKTGIQLEKIMETFFVTTVNYTKKFDDNEYQNEISFDRSITAFPAEEGTCSLYDALGRNFDQQILEESKLSRYTAIKTLPPVLHVLIQRTQSTGRKNGNPVIIPETLYLDRYMDAKHDTPAFRRRVEDWMIANRINDLKTQMTKVDSNPGYLSFLEYYGQSPSEQNVTRADQEAENDENFGENWDFDGPVDEDFLLVTPSKPEPTKPDPVPAVSGIRETDTTIREMMDNELKHREQTLEGHFEEMKQIAYRLHAVICHRGHLTSGHYWVWVHDFENNVWRWYNDSDVKENKDTAEVLQTLSTSGEPYYLCYVRDEDKNDYVDVPRRQRPTPMAAEEEEEAPAAMAAATAASTSASASTLDLDPTEVDEPIIIADDDEYAPKKAEMTPGPEPRIE